MSGCYYDPFKWADIYTSEEEYIKELEKCLQQKNEENTSEDQTSLQ